MSQIRTIKKKLSEEGEVTNAWAVENNILRLGAIIHTLRRDRSLNWTIKGDYIKGTKNYKYVLVNRPKRIVSWDTSTGVAIPIWK
jgi:hypothetical protein